MLLKLHFASWAVSVFIFDHLFVLLPSMFRICLLRTRVPTHFSAVHSAVNVCGGHICLLFNLLLSFAMY